MAAAQDIRSWISAQAQSGQTPEQVIATLVASGWTQAQALAAMQEFVALKESPDQPVTFSPSVQAAANDESPAYPTVPVPEPSIAGQQTTVDTPDRRVDIVLTMALPRVVVFGNLLSHAECDELMELAQARLTRSQAVVNETGASEIHEARTSDGMFFRQAESPLVARIEARIAALVNWPVERGEGLQILRYGIGHQYKPHWDYFDPAHAGTPTILKRGGQRVASLVMYLNTPARGGATTFPDVGLAVAPVKGSGVFFSYDKPHPSTKSLHAGAPVEEGEKWVATKWLRERTFT